MKRGLVILAGLLIVSGVVLYVQKELGLRRQVHAVATIVDFKTKRSSNRYSHFPIVEFEGPGGRPVRHESRIGSSRAIGSVGDKVDIYFKPGNPQAVTIDRFFQKHLVAVIVMFVGVGLLLVTRIRKRDAVSRTASNA
jgi:hypothetical protein